MAALFRPPIILVLYALFFMQGTCYLSQNTAERFGKAPLTQLISSTNFRAELNSVICLRCVGRLESHGVSYLAGRIKRYPNLTSTFQLTRVAISGDVSLNPGPSVKVKCSVCSRTLARNHRTVLCDCCKGLSHIKVCESDIQRVQTSSGFTKQDLGLLSVHNYLHA